VPIIASNLVNSEKVADHRGLVAYKGVTPKNQTPVTILTTGMGTGSSSIVLEEAYRAGGRVFIRIGSTGSFQPGDGIGSIFIPHAAIRDEGTSKQLIPIEFPATATPSLHVNLCNTAANLGINYKTGVVWTTDIYYDPAGITRYKKWINYGMVCVEMESSTLFIFGSLKGKDVSVATILTSDGNVEEQNSIYVGDLTDNNQVFAEGVQKTIDIVIETIEKMS
jgi:uridine phosphorylase